MITIKVVRDHRKKYRLLSQTDMSLNLGSPPHMLCYFEHAS